MKYIDEYRDPDLVRSLSAEIERKLTSPVRIMEVCGTHTMAIFRHGLRRILPDKLQLVSGPGCPVCVTPPGLIDAFCRVAGCKDVIITTFGDMIRVPGSSGSLADTRAAGADIRIVYSPADAIEIARDNPAKLVVFIAIGFETTIPLIAASILQAYREDIKNFCIFPANKIMPPALKILMQDASLNIDGLLCPGHVSIITGSEAFSFLAEDYGLSCAVGGFEPADILLAILALLEQINEGSPRVDNCYARAVTSSGNIKARELIEEVFISVDSRWRGLGIIAGSGLVPKQRYADFDVTRRLGIQVAELDEPPGCLCGEILKGRKMPNECPLFGKTCTPSAPIGPCMVSNEGTCAAWYRFGMESI